MNTWVKSLPVHIAAHQEEDPPDETAPPRGGGGRKLFAARWVNIIHSSPGV